MGLEKMFPIIKEIRDKELREKVEKCYKIAFEKSKINNIEEMPFTLLIQNAYSFVKHVNNVAEMAYEIGKLRNDVDTDILLAGALLHDIGKLVEYEEKDGKFIKSETGKYIRHPVIGAFFAIEAGLDEKVVNIIVSHSKEGEMVKRCNEAIIVHHCDFIDFEIARGEK